MDIETWLKERSRDEYTADLNRLACLLYWATKPDSEIDYDVRLEIAEKLLGKINLRQKHFKGPLRSSRWDGRNWRGVEPLMKRVVAAYEPGTVEL